MTETPHSKCMYQASNSQTRSSTVSPERIRQVVSLFRMVSFTLVSQHPIPPLLRLLMMTVVKSGSQPSAAEARNTQISKIVSSLEVRLSVIVPIRESSTSGLRLVRCFVGTLVSSLGRNFLEGVLGGVGRWDGWCYGGYDMPGGSTGSWMDGTAG